MLSLLASVSSLFIMRCRLMWPLSLFVGLLDLIVKFCAATIYTKINRLCIYIYALCTHTYISLHTHQHTYSYYLFSKWRSNLQHLCRNSVASASNWDRKSVVSYVSTAPATARLSGSFSARWQQQTLCLVRADQMQSSKGDRRPTPDAVGEPRS